MLRLVRTRAPASQQYLAARLRVQRRLSTGSGLQDAFKSLLRDSAQPVAVITARMPEDYRESKSENISTTSANDNTNGNPNDDLNLSRDFHGATLSSFSSVALEPYPLISFSLRHPSRMATAIISSRPHLNHPNLVINMLSSSQADLAIRFSRPDVYKDPFSGVPVEMNEEGLPVLRECVGALACRLISCYQLWELPLLEVGSERNQRRRTQKENDSRSHLFIARVLRIEPGHSQHLEPLVYHRQGYTTVQPIIKPHD